MTKRWLVIDCPYLCHRAFHSMGDLKHEDSPTGVLYGFLRDVLFLKETHSTKDFVFCFDDGMSLRKIKYPTYKSNRQEPQTKVEIESYTSLRSQIAKLKTHLLYSLGFSNVLYKDGYEADDWIAHVCDHIFNHTKDDAIIVSADQDLYQCLKTDRVTMWRPQRKGHETYTAKLLTQDYGVGPEQWAHVKAVAGCHTDAIPGVKGVGDLTACKFLRGVLTKDTNTYKRIIESEEVWKRNLELVKLPWPGLPSVELHASEVTQKKWQRAMTSLGIKTLTFGPGSLPVR